MHVSEYHDKRTTELLRQSALVNAKQSEKGTQSSGKRKRADTPTSETPETPGAPETVETPAPEAVESNASQLDSQVSRLRHSMKNVQLKCWPWVLMYALSSLGVNSIRLYSYPDDSSTFVRVSKHSDINALTKLVCSIHLYYQFNMNTYIIYRKRHQLLIPPSCNVIFQKLCFS